MKKADWCTKSHIDGGVLEDVVQEGDFMQFGMTGGVTGTKVEMVILFILNYSRHVAPKEAVKKNVLKSQEKKKKKKKKKKQLADHQMQRMSR